MTQPIITGNGTLMFKGINREIAEQAIFGKEIQGVEALVKDMGDNIMKKIDRISVYEDYISLFNELLQLHLGGEDLEHEIIQLLEKDDIYAIITHSSFIDSLYILFKSNKDEHFGKQLYSKIERLGELYHDAVIYNMLFDAIFIESSEKCRKSAVEHFISLFIKRHGIDKEHLRMIITNLNVEGNVFGCRIDSDDIERLGKLKKLTLI
ncbi:MAG: hypothetical protein PHS92_01875 [Candidatus Gracilibacteria bacterium]|nr:hypothetical protein [Candidatus Gracilibacteria bacterium]